VGNIQKALLYTSLDRLICRRIEPGPERTHLESLMKDCARDVSQKRAAGDC
jgi:hypothetical protein